MLQELGWSGVPALQMLPDGHRGRARDKAVRFSCAVLTRGRWRLTGVDTDPTVPSPERWLEARLERHGAVVYVGSFACPPGVDWGHMNAEQGRRIAEWMVRRPRPTIVGVDRNGFKFERADGSTQLWPRDAPQLLGPDPAQRCRDVLLALHDREPFRRKQAAVRRPDGPLEISYVRGRAGQRQTASFHDVVYASEHFTVEDVRYLYDESIAAGSDHAAVAVRLTLTA